MVQGKCTTSSLWQNARKFIDLICREGILKFGRRICFFQGFDINTQLRKKNKKMNHINEYWWHNKNKDMVFQVKFYHRGSE